MDMAGALSDCRACVLSFLTASDGSIATNASAKGKQTSFRKCWLKRSVGTWGLLPWTLVWITPDSLKIKISSTSHLQVQNQVKTANYGTPTPTPKEENQPTHHSGPGQTSSFSVNVDFWHKGICARGMCSCKAQCWERKVSEWLGLSFKEQNQFYLCFYMLTSWYYSIGLKWNNS